MAKYHTRWKVLPHHPIEKLSERLWRVEGDLPGDMPVRRVMTIAKRSDGGVVIHNGLCMDDRGLAEIEAWGPIVAIAVPNGYHRLDAHVFHERFPKARVICPSGARAKVEQVVPVTNTYEEEPADSAIRFEILDGTKAREGAMIVAGPDGTSIVLNDIIFNMPHARGFTGFVLRRLTQSTGGPTVSRISRWFLISDKRAVRAHLERLAATPDLRRVLVSHHEMIAADPARVLSEVAATL